MNSHNNNNKDDHRLGLFSRLAHLLGFSNGTETHEEGAGSRRHQAAAEALSDYLNSDSGPSSFKERQILTNIVRFNEMTLDDLMIRRADIIAIDDEASFQDILTTFQGNPYSRLPVYRETLDNPLGILHIKDVMSVFLLAGDKTEEEKRNILLSRLQHNVLFVPPSMLALDLLIRMQASHVHMALVIDEYGGTDGLVTLVDLVEEIVGNIGSINHNFIVAKNPDGSLEVYAKIDIETLTQELHGSPLLSDEQDEEDEIDTLGGLIVSLLGRVPTRGERVKHPRLPHLSFEILDADPRRIKRVLIRTNGDAHQ